MRFRGRGVSNLSASRRSQIMQIPVTTEAQDLLWVAIGCMITVPPPEWPPEDDWLISFLDHVCDQSGSGIRRLAEAVHGRLEHVMAGRVVAAPIPDAAHVTAYVRSISAHPQCRALTRARDRLRVIRLLEFDHCAGVELESGRRDGICEAAMIGVSHRVSTASSRAQQSRDGPVMTQPTRSASDRFLAHRSRSSRPSIGGCPPKCDVVVGTLSLVRCALL